MAPEPQAGQTPEPQIAAAVIEETFAVETLNVLANEATPTAPAYIDLRLLVGPAGANLFMFAKVGRIAPEMAIQLGEHLIEEGRRVQSRVAKATPADLAALAAKAA